MPDERSYSERRSSRSLYEQYINRGTGNSTSDNKSKFENKNNFRSDLSQYSIRNRSIKAGTGCKWDMENCSGVPMDYDSAKEILYVDGSDAHTLLIGATGSKKSRLVVMPTVRVLASAGENMVICDPKGEIFRRTAGFLEESGYNVHAINLREPDKGDGWNMLSVPYELYCQGDIDKACEFINDTAINLMPVAAKDPYWDYSSRDVLFGLILLLFKICNEYHQPADMVNMQNVLRLKEELFCSTSSYEIQRTNIWEYAKRDDLVRTRLNGTVVCPEKTLSCIISTFDQHMSCFTLQPKVIEMLSSSTFDLQKIGFEKSSVFLIMPDEKSTFHKIITIFLKQMYEMLIDNAYKKTIENRYPSRINFILDEFSSLPMISDFPQMITASRSRNIRFFLIVQSKHQLLQRYEEETETIMSNCTNWMFLTSRETELLREISELSGTVGSNRDPLISLSRLQHLDKEQGECLIFNGRKFPYIASLPDIDMYDQRKAPTLEMAIRNGNEKGNVKITKVSQGFFDWLLTESEKKGHNIPEAIDEEEYDLQKELEAKFDELFGPVDDDNE